jgi:hypothetical protein
VATAARRLLEQYVEAGLSKFVIRPAAASPASGPASFAPFVGAFIRELVPLQN